MLQKMRSTAPDPGVDLALPTARSSSAPPPLPLPPPRTPQKPPMASPLETAASAPSATARGTCFSTAAPLSAHSQQPRPMLIQESPGVPMLRAAQRQLTFPCAGASCTAVARRRDAGFSHAVVVCCSRPRSPHADSPPAAAASSEGTDRPKTTAQSCLTRSTLRQPAATGSRPSSNAQPRLRAGHGRSHPLGRERLRSALTSPEARNRDTSIFKQQAGVVHVIYTPMALHA